MPGNKRHVPGRKSRTEGTRRRRAQPLPVVPVGMVPSKVLVVNMIPRSLSAETHQDSEPGLAVNPANPLYIVGTAFTPDPMGGNKAPIYVSTDGGNTWLLNTIVPGVVGSATGTFDLSVAFSGSTDTLYGGILRDPTQNLEILRTNNFSHPTLMRSIVNRPQNDQPFVYATTVRNGPAAGRDRVYVGNNDFQAQPHTATIDLSLHAAATRARFTSIRLETRPTMGQDGPQIRPVCHTDGTVYVQGKRI